MIKRNELTRYLNNYLSAADFHDVGPNDLQVEGKEDISKIVTGVSACVALFEKAIEQQADAVIVHHGLIWEFERPIYKGGYKKRIKALLENDINLYGYHLPLDAHPVVGNNIVLANLLGLNKVKLFGDHGGQLIGMRGALDGTDPGTIFELIRDKINPDALIYPYGPDKIYNVGVISGGAQKDVKQAVLQGLDLYLTGEVSEHTMHYVKEEGIHFAAAGHHATERFGVRALGDHLRDKFKLEVEFIDVPNPV